MKIVLYSVILLLVFSCSSGNKGDNEAAKDINYLDALKTETSNQATLIEYIDVGTYTYLKLQEGNRKYWAAISSQPVENGKRYYYGKTMLMENFTSKQLNRFFDTIYFLQEFREQPMVADKNKNYSKSKNKTTSLPLENIRIDPIEGGISIAELYSSRDDLDQQEIIIRGIVVKMNKSIMEKNWIHIQDGTRHKNHFDLTITTNENMNFQLGDTITVHGRIATNRDYGYGYTYDVIVENATIQTSL